jgi:hypothetical protein
VIVDVERVGESAEKTALAFDELHMPTSPNDVIKPVVRNVKTV